MADPDLQTREGSGHPDPEASVWSNNIKATLFPGFFPTCPTERKRERRAL